jgi:hypothetical protein
MGIVLPDGEAGWCDIASPVTSAATGETGGDGREHLPLLALMSAG